MSKPVCIDLFCGLGGWTKGFLAEGWDVIGFDIEHKASYPGQYIEMDVAKLSGYDLRSVTPAVIVASPPCQAYSYRAMPWKRAKALPPPDNTLFNACFRIARECGVPLVVENVKGAQPWVGRAKWHYGSYYLWGDVPALMPITWHRKSAAQSPGKIWENRPPDSQWSGTHGIGQKNTGGSWFNVAHNTESGVGQNPVNGVKVPGLNWSGSDRPGYKAQAFNGTAQKRMSESDSFGWSKDSPVRNNNSHSPARKAASAAIAEIPFDLAQWIARCFKPAA